jgi:hypothetical protein
LWRLLAAQEIRIAPWEVIRLTFLGQLFNQIVPGTVGGDLVKAWYVARHTPHKGKVLMTLFVDRLVGLTEMTLLSLVMILVLVGGGADLGPLRTPMLSVAVVLALATGAFVALFWPGLRRALRLDRLVRRLPFAEQIASAERGAGQFGRRPGVLVEGLGLSLAAHVCWIAGLAAIGVGLGLPAAWYSYFLYIPLIYIIGSVPLTPGGVGLIEHFFLVFFVASGATASQVLALALLARLIPLFWALPGLAVVVTGTRVPPAETIEAELGVAGPAESK